MKTFLAIFRCAENSEAHQRWMKLSPEAQKEREQRGALALEQWTAKNKDRVVFEGGSLSELTKRVDTQGVHDRPSQMGAFCVVQAGSFDEAADLFSEHPHFAYFPGDAVEILERTPKGRQ